MSGLQITITTAGRAAQVNAENTGTAPVTITQIGITDQAVVTDEGMTALPGELKRLGTFAGAAVADDTIHVTIRDDSADVYSLRGFGLYLSDGTLYAVYGQADVVLEKSAQAMMLLATDIIFANIEATSLTFGDTNWINPPATTTVPGVVELATSAEAITATDATRALTPAAAKATTDSRFGVGAPSAFFKSLLALATAALMRTALELGNAATRNEGADNGLDADKLDGQHGAYYRAWANLSEKPASFTPSAHNHPWSEVSGAPATATRWPNWAEVAEKPASFAPSAHTHAAADINSGVFADARIPALAIGKTTGLQVALDSKAASVHPHAAADINSGVFADARIPVLAIGKTTGLQVALDSKAASVHPHAAADINSGVFADARIPALAIGKTTGLQVALDAKLDTSAVKTSLVSAIIPIEDPISSYPQGFSFGYTSGVVRNFITMRHASDNRVLQFLTDAGGGTGVPRMEFRTSHPTANGGGWTPRYVVHHSGNFDPSTKAHLDGPEFTGVPTGPTAVASTNTTQLATTAFVQAAITAALANYLTKNNPTFTGTMIGPAYNKS